MRQADTAVAIGGAAEQESFEVQAKVRVADSEPVLAALDSGAIEVLYRRLRPRARWRRQPRR